MKKIFIGILCFFVTAGTSLVLAQDAQELFRQGTAAIKAGNYDSAFKDLQEAHRLGPDDIGIANNLAVLYAYHKNWDKAIATLSAVVDKEPLPSRGILLYNLGGLYNFSDYKDKKEKAIETYEKSLEAMIHFGQAFAPLVLLYREDYPNRARRYLDRLMSVDTYLPDLPPTIIEKEQELPGGMLYGTQRDKFPQYYLYHSPAWFISLAIHYLKYTKYAEASEQLDNAEKALDATSGLTSDKYAFTEVHLYRAAIHLSLKEFDQALADLERGYKVNPKHRGVLTNIATLYYIKKDFARAKEYCEMALAVSPDFAPALELKKLLATQR